MSAPFIIDMHQPVTTASLADCLRFHRLASWTGNGKTWLIKQVTLCQSGRIVGPALGPIFVSLSNLCLNLGIVSIRNDYNALETLGHIFRTTLVPVNFRPQHAYAIGNGNDLRTPPYRTLYLHLPAETIMEGDQNRLSEYVSLLTRSRSHKRTFTSPTVI